MRDYRQNEDFSWALKQLKQGGQVKRAAWHYKYICLSRPCGSDCIFVKPLLPAQSYLAGVWDPTQEDLLAEDWGLA